MSLNAFRLDQGRQASMFIDELKKCGKSKDLARGKFLHHAVIEAGIHGNKYVGTALISMYSKCGSMKEAQQVFTGMLQPNVVSWTALIAGYVENGKNATALDIFDKMNFVPNAVTFAAALKACTGLSRTNKVACLQKGMALHEMAHELGFVEDIFVASTLVDMYGKAGEMAQARAVFNKMSHHDVVSWSALILGYVDNGQSDIALEMFAQMDCSPNSVTLAGVIKACAALATTRKLKKSNCLEKGVAMHKRARASGLERDLMVANALVDMYSKCGDMIRARDVFDQMLTRNAVSWNALMFGYLDSGQSEVALVMFSAMNVIPSSVTFVVALKSCAAVAASASFDKAACLQKGITVHEQAKANGFEDDVFVGSSLVDMYSKCGDMAGAQDAFNRMVRRDAALWSALICGYMNNGEIYSALDAFASMDCTPDKVTYLAVLKACASLGALKCGKEVHHQICMLGLERDETLANCLVDFYGKCCTAAAAEEVFNCVSSPDIISWSALIGSYCLLGNTPQVFNLVQQMLETHVDLDSVTMLLVLTACSHAGMAEEAQKYFESMPAYRVIPNLEHYTCMINILCRANRLEEALNLLKAMPFKANSPIWIIILVACEKWHNLQIAQVAFNALLCENDQEYVPTAYVLMRSLYQTLGMRGTCYVPDAN